jgi:hypothetical protein
LKRELPVFLTAVTGLILLADYYFNIPALKPYASAMQNWGVIIAAFTLALAAANLIKIHTLRVSRGGRIGNVLPSLVLLVGLFVTIFAGIFLGRSSPSFSFIFSSIYTPLAAAFYAMTAFHLASASYRAFRARSAQAAILLITGVLLMLGRAPIGETIWSRFPKIADWIMAVPNLAGSRGIMISIAVGVIGVSMRVLTGIDRAHLGAE